MTAGSFSYCLSIATILVVFAASESTGEDDHTSTNYTVVEWGERPYWFIKTYISVNDTEPTQDAQSSGTVKDADEWNETVYYYDVPADYEAHEFYRRKGNQQKDLNSNVDVRFDDNDILSDLQSGNISIPILGEDIEVSPVQVILYKVTEDQPRDISKTMKRETLKDPSFESFEVNYDQMWKTFLFNSQFQARFIQNAPKQVKKHVGNVQPNSEAEIAGNPYYLILQNHSIFNQSDYRIKTNVFDYFRTAPETYGSKNSNESANYHQGSVEKVSVLINVPVEYINYSPNSNGNKATRHLKSQKPNVNEDVTRGKENATYDVGVAPSVEHTSGIRIARDLNQHNLQQSGIRVTESKFGPTILEPGASKSCNLPFKQSEEKSPTENYQLKSEGVPILKAPDFSTRVAASKETTLVGSSDVPPDEELGLGFETGNSPNRKYHYETIETEPDTNFRAIVERTGHSYVLNAPFANTQNMTVLNQNATYHIDQQVPDFGSDGYIERYQYINPINNKTQTVSTVSDSRTVYPGFKSKKISMTQFLKNGTTKGDLKVVGNDNIKKNETILIEYQPESQGDKPVSHTDHFNQSSGYITGSENVKYTTYHREKQQGTRNKDQEIRYKVHSPNQNRYHKRTQGENKVNLQPELNFNNEHYKNIKKHKFQEIVYYAVPVSGNQNVTHAGQNVTRADQTRQSQYIVNAQETEGSTKYVQNGTNNVSVIEYSVHRKAYSRDSIEDKTRADNFVQNSSSFASQTNKNIRFLEVEQTPDLWYIGQNETGNESRLDFRQYKTVRKFRTVKEHHNNETVVLGESEKDTIHRHNLRTAKENYPNLENASGSHETENFKEKASNVQNQRRRRKKNKKNASEPSTIILYLSSEESEQDGVSQNTTFTVGGNHANAGQHASQARKGKAKHGRRRKNRRKGSKGRKKIQYHTNDTETWEGHEEMVDRSEDNATDSHNVTLQRHHNATSPRSDQNADPSSAKSTNSKAIRARRTKHQQYKKVSKPRTVIHRLANETVLSEEDYDSENTSRKTESFTEIRQDSTSSGIKDKQRQHGEGSKSEYITNSTEESQEHLVAFNGDHGFDTATFRIGKTRTAKRIRNKPRATKLRSRVRTRGTRTSSTVTTMETNTGNHKPNQTISKARARKKNPNNKNDRRQRNRRMKNRRRNGVITEKISLCEFYKYDEEYVKQHCQNDSSRNISKTTEVHSNDTKIVANNGTKRDFKPSNLTHTEATAVNHQNETYTGKIDFADSTDTSGKIETHNKTKRHLLIPT